MTLAEFDVAMARRAADLGMTWEYVRRDGVEEHFGAWNQVRSAVIAHKNDGRWAAVPMSAHYPAEDPINWLRALAAAYLKKVVQDA